MDGGVVALVQFCNTFFRPEDKVMMFSILQPLLSLSENLLVQLRSRMEAWDERSTRIGDIFVHTVKIKQLYPV